MILYYSNFGLYVEVCVPQYDTLLFGAYFELADLCQFSCVSV
ncbi:hypothetical protein PsAD46_03725 [Pseudovibrio sp. Ad46]|nr:hypothetical protein PsAD46_03725 [Pseudovibrio sp. Ad46]KZL01850.1 hypothetical protein PsAD5_00420 [Pseudovibrio sp. Ad5]